MAAVPPVRINVDVSQAKAAIAQVQRVMKVWSLLSQVAEALVEPPRVIDADTDPEDAAVWQAANALRGVLDTPEDPADEECRHVNVRLFCKGREEEHTKCLDCGKNMRGWQWPS